MLEVTGKMKWELQEDAIKEFCLLRRNLHTTLI